MVYCNASMIHNIPCKHFDTFQPSHMFTHHCVYSRKWLSVISRAQCHWISTTARCGPDSFQKVYVTALKVVALLLAAVLQRYYTIGTKKTRDEKKSASQNTQYMFYLFIFFFALRALKVLKAMCCSGVTSFSSLAPPNLVIFLRGTLAKWRACR